MGRIKHQDHKTELLSRSGVSFEGFQQLRDKETFEIAPPEKYREAYKITFRKYVEKWKERGVEHEFIFYQLSRRTSNRVEQIGRMTEYQTEDRLRSLLYRYFNPGHASPLSFHARVRFSGSSEASGLPAKMPYIPIASGDVQKSNLWVDDEVRYTVVNSRGEQYTEKYHLSQTATPLDGSTRSLILPLTRVKRLVVLDDGSGKIKYVQKTVYDQHTEDIKEGRPLFIEKPRRRRKGAEELPPELIPVHRFIEEGEEVALMISPEEWSKNVFMDRLGRFDFVINTLMLIESKRRAEARREAERERKGLPPLSEISEEDPEEGDE